MTRGVLFQDRRSRAGIACVLGATVLLLVAPAAIAQQQDVAPAGPMRVVEVDVSASPQAVVVQWPSAPQDPQISVNGQPATVRDVVPAGDAGYLTDNILIIDNSASASPRFDAIKAAVPKFFGSLQPNERVGVISAGGAPQIETGLTSDLAVLGRSAAQYRSNGAAAMYDSIAAASEILGGRRDSLHSITIITASADAGSQSTAAIARAEAIAATVSVNVVALTSDDFPVAATGVFSQLAAETGGTFVSTNDPAQLAPLVSKLAGTVRGLHAIRFETDQIAKGGNLLLSIGDQHLEVGFVPSSVTRGGALNQLAGDGQSGISFLQGSAGLAIVVVFGAVAAALVAYAAALMITKDEDGLTSVLQPYSGEDEPESESGFSKNALFQRAVEITSSIAERQGLLQKAESALEQANVPLRAAEALTFYAGAVLASFVLGFLLKRSFFWALLFGVIGVLVPPAVLNFKASRRRKKFLGQLPDTLQLLAGTLKAGYSFMQGVEAVSQEVEDPMGSEMRRVVSEAQLGRPVEEALEASAARMDSSDFEWAVMAVRIQREVGGNLAELLMTVAETMTARQRLRGEVAALTAEGRVSAMVLGILPIGLGFMLYLINPEYMGLLFSETIGRIMLLGAAVLAGAGFLWMKKIIDIKI
jgi:tight adherence protein B